MQRLAFPEYIGVDVAPCKSELDAERARPNLIIEDPKSQEYCGLYQVSNEDPMKVSRHSPRECRGFYRVPRGAGRLEETIGSTEGHECGR